MPNLKKVISLHQASQISGYHQDYLSALMRKGEMNGEKLGGNWFTTLEEINNYIFKQKIRNKNWFARNFLFFIKTHSSFIYAFVFLIILSTGIYFYNKNFTAIQTASRNTEVFQSKNLQVEEKINEMKF